MITGRLNPYGGSVVDPVAREKLNAIEQNIIEFNNNFDDSLGFWNEVKGGDKFDDTAVIHARELSENFNNLEVSPSFASQTLVHYKPESQNGENFTRMSSEYHELIGEGYCNATQDHSTPNFTAMGATCYNKFKGNVGMCAVIGRIEDVAYTDEELGISANDTQGTTPCPRNTKPS